MQEITLTLTVQEVNAILQVMGELPTKTGAYPLVLVGNSPITCRIAFTS